MEKTFCFCINIEALLQHKMGRGKLDRFFFKNDAPGYHTHEEATDYLNERLSQGFKFITNRECDNFDPELGCLGHIKEGV
jgi:hypothetical protein